MVNRPTRLDPLAERILERLSGRPEAGEIVLGGYFALQHYAAYRETHDIDAWWRIRPTTGTEEVVRSVMNEVAREGGFELRERRFGETLSWELHREGKKRFSFQIAVRSVELEPPVPSAWPPVLLETLRDNLGAKMNALVERGAPRDFTDIMQVVTCGHATIGDCWVLWVRKNPGASEEAAKRKLLFHLCGLELRRPLAHIADADERARAERTRLWFRAEFLGGRA